MLKVFLLLLFFAANLSNAIHLGRLNAQCLSQPLVHSGIVFPNKLRGQILGVSLNSLPPQTIGNVTFNDYFSAGNNHFITVTSFINSVNQGTTYHYSGVNSIGNGVNLSGSYLYSVQNVSPITVKYTFSQSPIAGSQNELIGVTAWDLTVISQHLATTESYYNPFTNPYQYIASDVNNDAAITEHDWLYIRSMLLGQYSSWQQSDVSMSSWRYMPFAYFANQPWAYQWSANPLTVQNPSYPQYLNSSTSILHDIVPPDFLCSYASAAAIKTGDASLDAYVNNCFTDEVIEDRGVIENTDYRNIYLRSGQKATLYMKVKNDLDIIAWQNSLTFDTEALDILDVRSGILPSDEKGIFNVLDKELRIVGFRDTKASLKKGECLMEITFKAKKDGLLQDAFSVENTSVFPNLFYNEKGEQIGVSFSYDFVSFDSGENIVTIMPTVVDTKLDLVLDATTIKGSVYITVYDVNGVAVLNQVVHTDHASSNLLSFDFAGQAAGLYFAKVQLDNGKSEVVKFFKK